MKFDSTTASSNLARIKFTDSFGTVHSATGTSRWVSWNNNPDQGGADKLILDFSPRIPASWIAFSIYDADIDENNQNEFWTIGVSGSASTSDFTLSATSDKAFTYNRGNGVVRPNNGNGQYSGTFFGNSDQLVSRITITVSNGGEATAYTLASLPTCVTVQKETVGGTGSFNFEYTNLVNATSANSTGDTLTTTATSNPASVDRFVRSSASNVTLNETSLASNYSLTSASCTDSNNGTSGNSAGSFGTLSGTTLTVPSNKLRPEANLVCTFTNTKAPTISLTKLLGSSGRISSSDQFTLSASGGADAPASVTTTGSGSTVGSNVYSFFATAGTTYALNEAMATGSASKLSQYGQTVSCSNTGPTDVSNLTSLPINVTPATGDAISCTVTNTQKAPTLSLQKAMGAGGRIAASDQFKLSGSGAGAAAAVTTTGSGSAITSKPYGFTATAGTAYTLDEAMAGGSASTLSQYSQSVACSNTGTTDVSGQTTLPITVTPAAGDAISCVITNTLKSTPVVPPSPSSNICNADPIVAGGNFTNAAWTKTGNWEIIAPAYVQLKDDNGDASLSQNVNGVTPGAIITFTWRYIDGVISSGDSGNQSKLSLSYGGVKYWEGLTSDGPGYSPTSSALAGATCVSGCGALSADTNRLVKIRLPANVPINGQLLFRAQEFGGTSDDPRVSAPVSIANTGICLVKTSNGNTGQFNFTTTGVDTTMGGGGTTASITTATSGAPVYYDASSTRSENQPLLVKNPGASANVTITETPASGFILDSVDCSGVTPQRTGNTITIANVPRYTVATCTFTNRTPIINLSKTLGSSRVADSDNFTVAIRTGGVNGTVVNSTSNSTTAGTGATVSAGTGTTGDFYTAPGTTYILTEAGTSGTNLANYNAWLTCTDKAGVTPTANLPQNVPFDPAAGYSITPLTGANLSCTINNISKTQVIPPSGGTGSSICNGNPIIASSDFTNPAWGNVGFNANSAQPDNYSARIARLNNDDGDASIYQNVTGVTPSALLTFTWWFRNGLISSGSTGNKAELFLYYTPASGGAVQTYWSASTSQGSGNAPASSAGSGATCLSGCSSTLPEQTNRTIQIRLPANVAMNGRLQFRIRTSGGTSDDAAIVAPVTIKNTGICLAKTSVGGVGQFNFGTQGVDTTMGGGGTTASIITSAVDTPTYYDASSTRTDNQPLLVKNPGSSANVVITETPAPGFTLKGDPVCTGNLTPVRSGNSITITNVPQDTLEICTFTNVATVINLSKALNGTRLSPNDNFTVAIRTGGGNGTIVNSPANSTTAGSGSTITAGTGTTGDFYAPPGIAYTLTESGTVGTNLSSYNATLSCTDSAGVMPAASLPNNESFNPAIGRAITPVAGANLRCVITNTSGGPTLSGQVFADNGTDGGTAHNGVVDGGELGLAGALVRVMSGSTVLSSVTTGPDGKFVVPIPAGVPIDIVVTAPTGYLAISENVGNTGASNPSVEDSKISFTPASGVSYSGITFGEVRTPTFAPDQTRTTTPGSAVFLPHVFVANTDGTVDFSVTGGAAAPDIPGWSTTLFRDSNCNGTFDSGEPAIAGPVTVSAGSQICVLLRVTAPAGAPTGAQYQTAVEALMRYNNSALTTNLSVTDLVTIAETSSVGLVKKVNATQAQPGDVLTYILTYKNSSAAPVSGLVIDDATPPYTTYVGSSAVCQQPLPASLSGCTVSLQPADGGTGAIRWTFSGSLQSGSEGQVKFLVKVSQ